MRQTLLKQQQKSTLDTIVWRHRIIKDAFLTAFIKTTPSLGHPLQKVTKRGVSVW